MTWEKEAALLNGLNKDKTKKYVSSKDKNMFDTPEKQQKQKSVKIFL